MNKRNLEMKSKQKVLKFRYREVFFFYLIGSYYKRKRNKTKKNIKLLFRKKKCWP